MSKPISWSHSSLSDFENCPRAYQLKRVTKEVKQVETEAMRYGTECHLHLENRLANKTTLPEHLEWLDSMMVMLEGGGGEIFTEQKMAVTKGLVPSSWMSDATWCRGVIDGGVRHENRSTLFDYKTGKRKTGSRQLMLFAALEFAHHQEIESVKTGFIWLKDKKLDTEVWHRKDVPYIWGCFVPIVARLERAFERDEWPAKSSGLCNPWCPATPSQCKFKK